MCLVVRKQNFVSCKQHIHMPSAQSDKNVVIHLLENIKVKLSTVTITFLFMFSNTMLVINAGIHKILVIIANREYPDQTASEKAVWSESFLFA